MGPMTAIRYDDYAGASLMLSTKTDAKTRQDLFYCYTHMNPSDVRILDTLDLQVRITWMAIYPTMVCGEKRHKLNRLGRLQTVPLPISNSPALPLNLPVRDKLLRRRLTEREIKKIQKATMTTRKRREWQRGRVFENRQPRSFEQ